MKLKVSSDGEIYLKIGVLTAAFKGCQDKYFCFPFGYISILFGFETQP